MEDSRNRSFGNNSCHFYVEFLHFNILCIYSFKRVFKPEDQLIQNTEWTNPNVSTGNEVIPNVQSRWSSIMRYFSPRSELDIEAQPLRPVQRSSYRTQHFSAQANTTEFYIERTQFMINGKGINSLDGMRQTRSDCAESYFTFLKVHFL